MYHQHTGSFFPLSKWLEEVRFEVIRYKFDEFSDHDFCYLQLFGWLQGVIFVKRRNRIEGGVFGSFSIDLIGFRTIESFLPPTLGVAAGGSFR